MRGFGLGIFLLACGAVRATEDPAAACLGALRSDARFAVMADKLPLADLGAVTPGMRANVTIPDQSEAVALAQWVEARRACLVEGAEFRKLHVPPSLAVIEQDTEIRLAQAVGDLAARKQAWGELAVRIATIAGEAKARHVATVRELRQQRQMEGRGQRETARIARQQAARDALPHEQNTADRQRAAREHQAVLDRSIATQQAARDAQGREAAARSAADTQRQLNSLSPPTQPALAPAVPVPPNVSCYATGVDWRCSPR